MLKQNKQTYCWKYVIIEGKYNNNCLEQDIDTLSAYPVIAARLLCFRRLRQQAFYLSMCLPS